MMCAFLIVCVLISSVVHAQQSFFTTPLTATKNTNAVEVMSTSNCDYIKQQMRKVVGLTPCLDPKKYCTDQKCHFFLKTLLAIPSNGLSYCYIGILSENGRSLFKSDILRKQTAAKAIFLRCGLTNPATFPPKSTLAPSATAPSITNAPLTIAPKATSATTTAAPKATTSPSAPKTTTPPSVSTPGTTPTSTSNRVQSLGLISTIFVFAALATFA